MASYEDHELARLADDAGLVAKADTKKRTATDGLRLREAAQRKRLAANFLAKTGDTLGAGFERREADDMARNADEMLALPSKPKIGTGGELFLSPEDSGNLTITGCSR